MSVEVTLPRLGESIAEGTIVRWLKDVGDRVERDEDLVLVATDKIETELPAPAAGILLELRAEVGQTVAVGQVIAVLGERAGAPAGVAAAGDGAPREGGASGSLVAQAAGRPPVAATKAVAPLPSAPGGEADGGREVDPKLFLSPVVRRLARENDIDPSVLRGSGRGGRVTRRDVEAAVKQGAAGSGFRAPASGWSPGARMSGGRLPFEPGTPERYAPQVYAGDTVEALSPLGRAMAEHMAWTWWRSPHVSTIVEIDMAAVAAHRGRRKADVAARGGRLSYTAYVARALARVLPRHPRFNASLDGTNRILHRDVNLAVAVARPDGGLVVPVLRRADGLSLGGVARELEELAKRARDGQISPADLSGGTFTLTNVGSNGNLASMPLINQPQVAILAMGAVTKRVVVVTDEHGGDSIAIRPRMFLTLTYDHRAVDGAASGRFLRELREVLEQWSEEP